MRFIENVVARATHLRQPLTLLTRSTEFLWHQSIHVSYSAIYILLYCLLLKNLIIPNVGKVPPPHRASRKNHGKFPTSQRRFPLDKSQPRSLRRQSSTEETDAPSQSSSASRPPSHVSVQIQVGDDAPSASLIWELLHLSTFSTASAVLLTALYHFERWAGPAYSSPNSVSPSPFLNVHSVYSFRLQHSNSSLSSRQWHSSDQLKYPLSLVPPLLPNKPFRVSDFQLSFHVLFLFQNEQESHNL